MAQEHGGRLWQNAFKTCEALARSHKLGMSLAEAPSSAICYPSTGPCVQYVQPDLTLDVYPAALMSNKPFVTFGH